MKIVTLGLIAAMALTVSQPATSGVAATSFQVGFVVTESCSVRSTVAAPVVLCQLASPYAVTHSFAQSGAGADAAPTLVQTTPQTEIWQVSF